MIGLCNRCGRSHELDTSVLMCGTFTTFYGSPAMTFSPPCAKCAQLERDLAAACAEAKKLEGAVTQMSRAARSLEKKLEAEKAEAARLREAIHRAIDSACAMGADDIDTLVAALEARQGVARA